MDYVYLDFETRSRVELRRAGTYRYAEDPSTEVLCASWALNDGPVRVWRAGESPQFLNVIKGALVVAHNAEFEREILAQKFQLRLPPSRFRCTSALAASYGLPRSLDLAGRALNLEHLKDKDTGSRVLHKLAKPRRPSKDNPDEFWERDTAPEDFEELEAYNEGDVEVCRDIHKLLPALSASEQKIWELTVTMNERGVRLDVEALNWLEQAAAEESARLAVRWEELTGVKPGSPKARQVLGLQSLAKLAVRQALRRPDLPPQVREALKVRQQLARTSLRKTAAMRAQVCEDGRLRGLLVYAGAERTARWSGGGVQVHNLPRGAGKDTDFGFRALQHGVFEALYEDVLGGLSDLLKGLLVGPWLIGDYGQIEARTLAVLAGQKDLVQGFKDGADIYCDMASTIYGHPVDKKSYDPVLKINHRQLGKMAILGCGYGMWAETFMRQAEKDYDVLLDEDTATNAVVSYREKYPAIVKFWGLLERGMTQAVTGVSPHIQVGPVQMGRTQFGGRPFAFIVLPSGRRMYYYLPSIRAVEKHGRVRTEFRYFGRSQVTHQWQMVDSYGGKQAENVTQATARDLLAHAMVQLEDGGFPLAMTVHDEIASHDPMHKTALEEFEHIMKTPPDWGKDIPLAVEAYSSWRYRKDS